MESLFGPTLLQKLSALVLGVAPESDEERLSRVRLEAQTALLVKSQRGIMLEDLEHAIQALRHFVAAKESGLGGHTTKRMSKRDQQLLLEHEETKEQHQEATDKQRSSLLMESTDEPRRVLLTDAVGVVNVLCSALDRCVSHGLRSIDGEASVTTTSGATDASETVKFFGVVKWTCSRVDAIRRKQMVDAMHVATSSVDGRRIHDVVTSSVEPDLPRAIRGFVAAVRTASSLTSVQSDEGKACAFLRQALNMHVLQASMSMVLSESNLDLLRSYYTDLALFRQRDDVKVFLHLLTGLDALPFAFLVDDPRLDLPPEELPFSKPLPKPKPQKIKRRAPKLIDPEDMVGGRVRLCEQDDDTNLLAEKLVSHHELRSAFDSLKGGNPLSEILRKAAQSQKLEDAGVAVLRFLELGYPEYDVFGTELLSVLCNPFLSGMARFETSLGIPDVVEACICYLYEHVDTPGLFQVHLQADHVMELRDTIEEVGGFHKRMAVDPHEVTAILYQYLWELPDALFTAERLDNFLACGGGGGADSGGGDSGDGSDMNTEEKTMLLRVLVNDLPWFCKPLLERLCHLVDTALQPAHAKKNGLTLYAVANVLAPLLLRKRHAARLDDYEDAMFRKYPVGYQHSASVRFRVLPGGGGVDSYPGGGGMYYASEAERLAAERRLRRHAARDAHEGAQVLSLMFQQQSAILRDFRAELAVKRGKLRDKVYFLESLRFKLEEPIDTSNVTHVALLKRLWDVLLKPTAQAKAKGEEHTEEEELITEEEEQLLVVPDPSTGIVDLSALLRSARWRRSGFHTENPLGGFRGGGLLSLECLIFFLEEYSEKATSMMARNALPGGSRYPFPVACINVLRMLMKLLMLDEAPEMSSKLVLHATDNTSRATVLQMKVAERVSRAPFWHVLDGGASSFFQLHAMAFMLLDLHWVHAGATQMGFQPVLDATRRQVGWLLEQAPQSVEEMWTTWMEVREQHATKYTPVYSSASSTSTRDMSAGDALAAEIQRKQKEQQQKEEEEEEEAEEEERRRRVSVEMMEELRVAVEENKLAATADVGVPSKELLVAGGPTAEIDLADVDPAIAY